MRELGSADGKSEEGWATVRIDGRDWGKVMSVGRLSGRVIACTLLLMVDERSELTNFPGFCDDHALILYVFLSNDEESNDSSVLTVS